MIIIPMAGLSSRFFKAGFKQPKYMLEAHGCTLFAHAINSFKDYFSSEHFLFIVRDVQDTPQFVAQQATSLGIVSYEIKILNEETRGQAETVYLGSQHCNDHEPITIFNIDTFRPGFNYPASMDQWDGYLEVFSGEGDNWSYARPVSSKTTKVIETAEKRRISDLCCTGLYQFSSLKDYRDSYLHYLSLPAEQWDKGELYVAPLYNYLIQRNKNIHYHLIDRNEVIFCGVPDEYYEFLEQK
ncbi:Nucleoside-diphosphate-sugar pyrophosphorylase involved in lipopolysaccharide biosynthesis/translation initiation factor 2B, gamma/epsilon subunits (eIF-2Bgamma/eIF-2Bepsilon) [Vibrio chagasii]|uniref:glycosyltransferase family 2 protein n=1 Tax=Vibrio chagasii TaxID=170679 RepID=UPI003379BE58|nr:Nucleoside-diphosphate-sugar pyrophosphorylase involved in lipopolysaccharide biosynthesis/translation initiation factor 2B, gamma/epsilon subunits (eIF-2Bgamma/eIF-2Bepsilon) [Vibrio chagasii]CAH7430528.1 Nucleoside-diphosphate-sugar pyrophosphorylase involved in lipopolysaccharide biosynthesis/translation initiation factor 2B, gamma/epsilon subunits (eIF-2Bgamma/eIF-2Bepsilon) [Vibrio chagasii]CAH7484942.1 Nucleoside-diphosphate-sugar pyrophosphorylase involved in lipopolysaccharide biosynth